VKCRENARKAILSPVCLPFHHTGNAEITICYERLAATGKTLYQYLCDSQATKATPKAKVAATRARLAAAQRKRGAAQSISIAPPTFAKVTDSRKQPIRGLWSRNWRCCAQLEVGNPITGIKKTTRVPLVKDSEPVRSAAEAVAEWNQPFLMHCIRV
jgi:hypothetical protein